MPDTTFRLATGAALLAAASLLLSAPCSAQEALTSASSQKPGAASAGNPAPLEKFSSFQHFELMPLTSSPGVKGPETIARLQGVINERVAPAITGWNEKAAADASGRTLVIQPHIASLKFSSVTKRIFAGPFSGSSNVQLTARYFDKATGAEVASPKFFSSVALVSGMYTMGGQDIAMLYRVVTLFADYTRMNYDLAVGGPISPQD